MRDGPVFSARPRLWANFKYFFPPQVIPRAILFAWLCRLLANNLFAEIDFVRQTQVCAAARGKMRGDG
jgi:hypothetical protein